MSYKAVKIDDGWHIYTKLKIAGASEPTEKEAMIGIIGTGLVFPSNAPPSEMEKLHVRAMIEQMFHVKVTSITYETSQHAPPVVPSVKPTSVMPTYGMKPPFGMKPPYSTKPQTRNSVINAGYSSRWEVSIEASAGHADAIAFSPDGACIATRSRQNVGSVLLLDASSGEQILATRDRASRETPVSFSPDGNWLGYLCEGTPDKKTGQYSNELHLWNIPKRKLERYWAGTQQSLFTKAITFSPDSKTITAAQEGSNLVLFNIRNGRVERVLKHDFLPSYIAKYSRDGKYLLTVHYQHIKCWDVRSGTIMYTIVFGANGQREFYAVAISPDNRIFASGSTHKTVEIWDIATGQNIAELRGHSEWVSSVTFSPDGSTLASASGDGTIVLWNTSDWRERRTIQVSKDKVGSIAFSPTKSILASASIDGTVRVWDID